MFWRRTGEQKFYEILRAEAENAVEAASLLHDLLEEPSRFPEIGPAIKDLESRGDRYTHDLFALLNKSRVTPVRREDLATMAVAIDSVVDGMEAAAARIGIYQVTETDRYLKSFGQTLRAMAGELVASIDLLAGGKLHQLHDRAIQINLLENQGDETLRGGLTSLYEKAGEDPVRFVTMKEIYETLEEATDRVEDVSNILEGVMMRRF